MIVAEEYRSDRDSLKRKGNCSMQTRQTTTHSPSTTSTAAESTPKAAISAAAATRVPAWANAWGDQPPTDLSLDEEAMAQPDSSAMSRPGDRYEREADQVADQMT